MSQEAYLLDQNKDKACWERAPAAAFESLLRAARFENARGYSESSIQVYLSMWGKFLRHLHGRERALVRTTAEDLARFFAELRGKSGAAPSESIQRRYHLILTLAFRHLAQIRAIARDPMGGFEWALEFEKERRPLPVTLDVAEEANYREHIGQPRYASDWRALRDAALQSLILAAGLRVSEARVVKTMDLSINAEHCVLTVPACGVRRARTVPVALSAHASLAKWLDMRRLLSPAGDLMFPASRSGEPMAASTIYRHVAHTFERAGLDKAHAGPAILRHTFAARQVAGEVPLKKVSGWLGHEVVSSTEVYQRVTEHRKMRYKPA